MAFVYPMLPGDLQALRQTHARETVPLHDQQLPYPWAPVVHPDGTVSFYHPHYRLLTWVNPQHPGNAECLENAAQQLRQQLPVPHIPEDPHVVIGLTNDRRVIGYYLIHPESRRISWAAEFTPQTFGYPANIDEGFFKWVLQEEYWKHVSFYPSRTPMNIPAENDLLARLIAGQLGNVNRNMTPFSVEECRNHHLRITHNKKMNPDDHRMAEIGRLSALIHAHLRRMRYEVNQRIPRLRRRVDHVPRRAYAQPELCRFLGVWLRNSAQVLTDTELSTMASFACLVMLAPFGSPWPITGGLLIASISATLLLHSKFTGLYRDLESLVMGATPNRPIRSLILTCLFVFNALSYAFFLGAISQHLGALEHIPSPVEVVISSLVLAFPTVAYVIWSNHAFAREVR